MKSSAIRTRARTGVGAVGIVLLNIPLAARVIGQLVSPAVHPARKVLLAAVLVDGVLAAIEAIQSPIDHTASG